VRKLKNYSLISLVFLCSLKRNKKEKGIWRGRGLRWLVGRVLMIWRVVGVIWWVG